MSKQIQLRVVFPPSLKQEEFVGLFLSFLSAVSEVSDGTRKSTYLNQFYRERLNKNEKRVISSSLGQLLKQLGKMNESFQINESSKDSEKLPPVFLELFKRFQLNEMFDFDGAASISSGPLDRQGYRTRRSLDQNKNSEDQCLL